MHKNWPHQHTRVFIFRCLCLYFSTAKSDRSMDMYNCTSFNLASMDNSITEDVAAWVSDPSTSPGPLAGLPLDCSTREAGAFAPSLLFL